jgi:glutaredoxin
MAWLFSSFRSARKFTAMPLLLSLPFSLFLLCAAFLASAQAAAPLPYALQQIANRFPVVLYTRTDCAPCDEGRNHLLQRGIPFTEKTANTPADNAALKSLEGTTALPVLRIGQQQLQGYSSSAWTQYLDAAGYPATSALPPSYRSLPAQPLTPPPSASSVSPATTANDPNSSPATAVPKAPPKPEPTTPGGIRF